VSDVFLVDTVTLSKMTASQRTSQFMRERCMVPSEVLYEARGMRDINVVAAPEYVTTVEVLNRVAVVVASLTEQDKLLNLYENKGNGDVFLLAVALAEAQRTDQMLFGDRYVIATDDKGLRRKAADLEVPTCSSSEFIALLS